MGVTPLLSSYGPHRLPSDQHAGLWIPHAASGVRSPAWRVSQVPRPFCRDALSALTPMGRTAACADCFTLRAGFIISGRLATHDLCFEVGTGSTAVPYSAATHGKEYWLSAGEPHCANCHAAPYVEGQGGVAFPINQPGKYSLMRYSKGHAGLACQACHQSIHGLYPVDPGTDSTTYKQAALYNPDGSHGPIKCAACHEVNDKGVPFLVKKGDPDYQLNGKNIVDDFDAAVTWMHRSAPDLGGKIPEEDDD